MVVKMFVLDIDNDIHVIMLESLLLFIIICLYTSYIILVILSISCFIMCIITTFTFQIVKEWEFIEIKFSMHLNVQYWLLIMEELSDKLVFSLTLFLLQHGDMSCQQLNCVKYIVLSRQTIVFCRHELFWKML